VPEIFTDRDHIYRVSRSSLVRPAWLTGQTHAGVMGLTRTVALRVRRRHTATCSLQALLTPRRSDDDDDPIWELQIRDLARPEPGGEKDVRGLRVQFNLVFALGPTACAKNSRGAPNRSMHGNSRGGRRSFVSLCACQNLLFSIMYIQRTQEKL